MPTTTRPSLCVRSDDLDAVTCPACGAAMIPEGDDPDAPPVCVACPIPFELTA